MTATESINGVSAPSPSPSPSPLTVINDSTDEIDNTTTTDNNELLPHELDRNTFNVKYEKLNSLLDQTELYSTFLASKMPTRYNHSTATNPIPIKVTGKRKKSSVRQLKNHNTTSDTIEHIAENYGDKSTTTTDHTTHNHLDKLNELVPSGLQLRGYQLEGVDWLISLYENGLNGILADEMGLGKTIQLILFLSFLYKQNINGPFLIVTPLSTVHNWNNELNKWAPYFNTVIIGGDKSHRNELWNQLDIKHCKNNKLFPVLITNYEIIINDYSKFNSIQYKFIIIDEGQKIKNINSILLKHLKQLTTENRLILTGTPLQNNLRELWSLLNFVLPDIFDDLSRFERWFEFDTQINTTQGQNSIIENEKNYQLVSKLHTILRPFVLRRLKNEVLINELPQKREFLIFCPMTPLQYKYYNNILQYTMKQLKLTNGISMNNMLMQLRKIANHPYLLYEPGVGESDDLFVDSSSSNILSSDRPAKLNAMHALLNNSDSERDSDADDYFDIPDNGVNISNSVDQHAKQKKKKHKKPYTSQNNNKSESNNNDDESLIYHSGKLLFVDRLVTKLLSKHHKILIFSQMTRMLDILEDWLIYRHHQPNINYCRLDGHTKTDQRDQQMKLFNTSKQCRIFLLSTRAGGLGINLVSADSVIIYDSDWNPTRDMQAMDRCHRIGQTEQVHVYRLLTPASVEVQLLDRAIIKRKLERVVMARGRFRNPDQSNNNNDKSNKLNKMEEIVNELINVFKYKSLPDIALNASTLHQLNANNNDDNTSNIESPVRKRTRRSTATNNYSSNKNNKSIKKLTNVLSDQIIDLLVSRTTTEDELREFDYDHTDALANNEATYKDVSNDVNFQSILEYQEDDGTHGKNLFG